MKLLPAYSLTSGLKIGEQFLLETFYPLPVLRYITIQAASGMAGKNYPYYNDVILLVRDALEKAGISIVQIGGKDDQPVIGAIALQGKTTLHQSNYLLKRALLHVGNDSWASHRAGALNIPLVCLYGPTSVANHSPYKYNKDRTVLIESHRFGRNPTFVAQENPPTIALIPPEQVAAAILKTLDLPNEISRKSVYVGSEYSAVSFDVIPNAVVPPQTNIGVPMIRMDLDFNEQGLAANLQVRKSAITTEKEINPNLLAQFRPNIALLRIYVDNVSAQWIKTVKRIGVPIQALSRERDEDKLRKLRLDLFDVDCFFDVEVMPTVENLKKEIEIYTNKTLDTELNLSTLSFRTNHFYISSGKIYLSVPHWRKDESVESTDKNEGKVVDAQEFWEEQKRHYYFTS